MLSVMGTGQAALPEGKEIPRLLDGRYSALLTGDERLHGKVRTDTVYLMGGDADPNWGDFEDASGAPSWDGWTPVDLTAPISHWNIDTYNAANLDPRPDNHAWWCGWWRILNER